MKLEYLQESSADTCLCPIEISDGESVARAIFYSFHIKKSGVIKWQAFKPDIGDDSISVMRHPCLSEVACKDRAKAMVTPQKHYRGFSLAQAYVLRQKGFEIADSRELFCGHADLHLGVTNQPQEPDEPPADPNRIIELENVCRSLMEIFSFYQDLMPESQAWMDQRPWLWPTPAPMAGDALAP